MLLLQSASVEFLSLDSIIKYNTVLSLVMCPLCRYRITKTGDESALYEPEAPQMLPGCPALWWLSGLDAEQWAPCVCVTGSLPGCAQTDYPVWTSVTLDAHQSLLLSVVWFQTSGTGQSCVWLDCVCVWFGVRYLEDSGDDEHGLVWDLWVFGPAVQSVPKLPAGFGPGRPPEDTPGVRPLQVQEHQHVLERRGRWKVTLCEGLDIIFVSTLKGTEDLKFSNSPEKWAGFYRWQLHYSRKHLMFDTKGLHFSESLPEVQRCFTPKESNRQGLSEFSTLSPCCCFLIHHFLESESNLS